MAVASDTQAKVLEAIRERFGRMPWVRAVLVAPDPAGLQVWTVVCPPDDRGEVRAYSQPHDLVEEAIYSQEVSLIRAFPEEHFDFHLAERTQMEDLKRAGAVVAFTR
jgi:hypothetical protein